MFNCTFLSQQYLPLWLSFPMNRVNNPAIPREQKNLIKFFSEQSSQYKNKFSNLQAAYQLYLQTMWYLLVNFSKCIVILLSAFYLCLGTSDNRQPFKQISFFPLSYTHTYMFVYAHQYFCTHLICSAHFVSTYSNTSRLQLQLQSENQYLYFNIAYLSLWIPFSKFFLKC